MGGKGGSTQATPPPVQQPNIDIEAMMAPMMGAMEAMMRTQASQPPPPVAPMPEITTPDAIDWSARQKEVQDKISKDVASELSRKRGRASTVLTSPLVEGEEIKSISASLSGS